MTAKRATSGLGRGLSALIGEAQRAPEEDIEQQRAGRDGVREIEIARIHANPYQPRTNFDEDAIVELAESIASRGVLQPILLRASGDGYQIIAGERRWRAAQRAQLHTIPAIVREMSEATTAEVALIENIQREDLNAIEEADAYRQLIERHGHSQDAVGKLVHKSRSHVANLLRLLDLPESVRESLVRGELTMGHARAVASADDPEVLAREIVARGLSVRQAEALAKKARPGPGADIGRASARNAVPNPDLAALERQLSDVTGLKVKVAHNGASGTVTIHYSNLDQLDMVCQRLTGEPI